MYLSFRSFNPNRSSRYSGNLLSFSRTSLLTCSMYFRFLAPVAVAAWAATLALPFVSSEPVDLLSRTAAGIDVKTLAPTLSPACQIYFKGSAGFNASVVRWSNLDPPAPTVVIIAGTEQDVSKIVSFLYSAWPCLTQSKHDLTRLAPGQIRVQPKYSHPCLQWSPWFHHYAW